MENNNQVVLSVDDNDVDGALLERAFKRCNIPSRLFRVSEGPQAMAYLTGHGIYADRALVSPSRSNSFGFGHAQNVWD